MHEFLLQIDGAQEEINATLEHYASQFYTNGTLTLSDASIETAIEHVKDTVEKLVEDALDTTVKAKDIFAPNFPTKELMQLNAPEFGSISFKLANQAQIHESYFSSQLLLRIALTALACFAVFYFCLRR